jgi:hypothetical protein
VDRASGRVEATFRSIKSVVPGARVSVSAGQDRFHGELQPSWTLRIDGPLGGSEFSIELAGPILGQLLDDAVEALVTLGFDVPDEPDAHGPTYTPVSGTDPGSYPA